MNTQNSASSSLMPQLIPYSENEKWGYKNEDGKIVIDPVFDYAPEFRFNTELLIETGEDSYSRYYLYSPSGTRLFCFNDLFDEDISEINRFRESELFFVDVYDWTSRELCGMVDEQGSIIIPPKFDSIEPVGEDLFKVGFVEIEGLQETARVKMKYGIYHRNGKEIFAPQFDEVGDFENGVALAELNGKEIQISNAGFILNLKA